MPTGSLHYKVTATRVRGDGTNVNDWESSEVECRCTIGKDHNDEGEGLTDWLDDDDDDDDDGEGLSVHDAADIWLSNGQDEDYMFGYTEEELRRASGG